MLLGTERSRRHHQNSVVAALDVGVFTDLEEYRTHVDNLIDGVKALPKADGIHEVLVPGEPEDRMAAERMRHGIPLPPGTWRNLGTVATRFGLELPPALC